MTVAGGGLGGGVYPKLSANLMGSCEGGRDENPLLGPVRKQGGSWAEWWQVGRELGKRSQEVGGRSPVDGPDFPRHRQLSAGTQGPGIWSLSCGVDPDPGPGT